MPDRDPLTGVPPSRHPFQFWVLAACVLSGIQIMIGSGRPTTMEAVLPDYMVVIWGITLLISGGLGIVAGWWPDRITGLLLERIALGTLCGVSAIYGVVVASQAGGPAVVTSSFQISVSVAAGWRIVHVNRELRTLQRWIERNLGD